MNRSVLRRIALLLGVLLCVVLLLIPLGNADFGDFGGDSDSGGDSGGWDSDYDSGHGHSSASGFAWIVLGIIIIVILENLEKPSNSSTDSHSGVRQQTKPQMKLSAYMQEHDPDLNTEQLQLWIKKLYCDMQVGWEGGNIENVRDRFDADAWNRFASQLKAKTSRNEVGHTRGITFNKVDLVGVNHNSNVDTLYVKLVVKLNLWHTCDGRVISNNPAILTRMTYEWALTRAAGSRTVSGELSAVHCPNCGKEVDMNAFAVCPFCGTQLSRPGVTWVLANIKALAQDTIEYNAQRSETPAETAARIVAEAEEKGIRL